MHPAISEEQWAAIRAVREGAAQTFPLLAAAAGMNVATLRERAARDKWDKLFLRGRHAEAARARLNVIVRRPTADWDASDSDLDTQTPPWDDAGQANGAGPVVDGGDDVEGADDPVELLSRASGFVSRQIARLMANAERRGGRLDKMQIDGLVALSKMMERWETLATERARKDKKKSDDELARMLKEIDDRIIHLAQAEAERLFQKRMARGAG